MKEIKMPKLSPTMEVGVLSKWLVKKGDFVKKGSIIGEIETDKAIMEIESFGEGKIGFLLDIENKEVPVNQTIGYILEASDVEPDWNQIIKPENFKTDSSVLDKIENIRSEAKTEDENLDILLQNKEKPQAEFINKNYQIQNEIDENFVNPRKMDNNKIEKDDFIKEKIDIEVRIIASPLAKKIAEDNEIDLKKIRAENGFRIMKSDVLEYLANSEKTDTVENVDENATYNKENFENQNIEEEVQKITKEPSLKNDLNNEVQENNLNNLEKANNINENDIRIEISGLRKFIAAKLTKAKNEIPHIYMQKKLYLDNLLEVKNKFLNLFGFKISLTPFFIKAAASALQENPSLNATLTDNTITFHSEINIGIAISFATGLDQKLYVPVIKQANLKSVKQISQELSVLIEKAKQGRLTKDDMSGGTFTISNLGMYEIDCFTAIINQPEVAILAISSSFKEPFYNGTEFVPSTAMQVNLSADHRALDGANAAKFMQSLAKYIQNPEGMLL